MARAGLALALAAALAWPSAAPAQEVGGTPETPPSASVFDEPTVAAAVGRALSLIRRGETGAARDRLTELAARYGALPGAHLGLAVAEAARGEREAAVAALEAAAARGLPGLGDVLSHPAFAGVLDDAARARIRAAARPPREPERAIAVPRTGAVAVDETTTVWDREAGVLRPRIAVPPAFERRPPVGPAPLPPELARELAERVSRGEAAGLAGVLYDNRDRGHSRLRRTWFPQMARIVYGEAARARGLDLGPARHLDFGHTTLGNSSTALVRGPYWRSQSRRLLTETGGPQALARQYAANHLYVYPEKDDHDPGHGDLFPANTPSLLTSQGASGSDRPFLVALAAAIAAMRPEVRGRLEAEGLMAPTLQMLLRRSMAGIGSDGDYLSGIAHPAAFEGDAIELDRLVARASALTASEIPPAVRLAVLSESVARPGRDYFAPPVGERLFTTPGAVARIWRSTAGTRRMTVSARATEDPNGRALAFRWVLLRGDPEAVAIRPLREDTGVVEIEMRWHDPGPVPGRPDLPNRRIEIGVFADNGETLSAPAFISVWLPPDATRIHDAEGRLVEIDYTAWQADYADPLLHFRRDWRDVHHRDPAGRLTHWTRHRGGERADYTPDGARVLSRDGAGRPVLAERVRYEAGEPGRNGMRPILEVPTGETIRYEYGGPTDRVPRPARRGFTD